MFIKPMAYSIKIKQKATNLRKSGYSIKEIAQLMNIAQSTSSLWLKDVNLNDKALKRLEKQKILGQYKSMQTAKEKRTMLLTSFDEMAKYTISKIELNNNLLKLLASILFWTEGSKRLSVLSFTNSDPNMVSLFMSCLRSSFSIDENKFRVKIHVHEYHDEKYLKKYWSKVTRIPLSQFSKCYLKPHTQKRKRENYMGCINIRYYDYKVALELSSIYNTFTAMFLGL